MRNECVKTYKNKQSANMVNHRRGVHHTRECTRGVGVEMTFTSNWKIFLYSNEITQPSLCLHIHSYVCTHVYRYVINDHLFSFLCDTCGIFMQWHVMIVTAWLCTVLMIRFFLLLLFFFAMEIDMCYSGVWYDTIFSRFFFFCSYCQCCCFKSF